MSIQAGVKRSSGEASSPCLSNNLCRNFLARPGLRQHGRVRRNFATSATLASCPMRSSAKRRNNHGNSIKRRTKRRWREAHRQRIARLSWRTPSLRLSHAEAHELPINNHELCQLTICQNAGSWGTRLLPDTWRWLPHVEYCKGGIQTPQAQNTQWRNQTTGESGWHELDTAADAAEDVAARATLYGGGRS